MHKRSSSRKHDMIMGQQAGRQTGVTEDYFVLRFPFHFRIIYKKRKLRHTNLILNNHSKKVKRLCKIALKEKERKKL
ncbi:CLUMA_CG010077, isoform A [Clunio marinus]|uniref:CLUMA_CG010077, isoform A n=1 Tax=Clunio marinus TaxID=568069 RepID=A0A1J1I9N6_9DIPT|nr:CLUMA_CG010077, isoform A [Clunio marinus]